MFVLVFVVFVLVVLVHVVTVSTWKSGLSKTELALGRYRSAASKAKSKFQTYTRPVHVYILHAIRTHINIDTHFFMSCSVIFDGTRKGFCIRPVFAP